MKVQSTNGTDTARRPDPRRSTSWCREGVAHDHGACGLLWNPHDSKDVEFAVRLADDEDQRARESEREAAEYAQHAVAALDQVARLVANYDDASAVPLDELVDVLREAGHAEFLPDEGGLGTGWGRAPYPGEAARKLT